MSACTALETGPETLPGTDSLVWPNEDGSVAAICAREGDLLEVRVPDVARMSFDGSRGRLSIAVAPGASEIMAKDLFRRFGRPMMMQALGAEMVHASAVLGPHGVVAFCGASGAGKSTLARALARTGVPPIADDALVFEMSSGGTPRALPLSFRFRLDSEQRQPLIRPRSGDGCPSIIAFCELSRLSAGPERLERLSRTDAFLTLFRHAFAFTLGDRERTRRTLERYMSLGARASVYRLHFMPDAERLSHLVDLVRGRLLNLQSDVEQVDI